MPLSNLQTRLLSLLAAQRSPDSYIAGAIAINQNGPRFSDDIDIFHDSDKRLIETAEADAAVIVSAGFNVKWLSRRGTGKRSALVSGIGEKTLLEWAVDSDFRFFPAQPDKLFGYVLHPADLATNKASAAADRREPRDIVDLLTIHKKIIPLGAVISAAAGRFPGVTPEEMLQEIRRHSTFTAAEFQSLAVQSPLDPRKLHKQIKEMLADAEQFIAKLPSDAIGFLFLENGKPIQPDPLNFSLCQLHTGSRRGHWPSSPEISRAMLDRAVASEDEEGGLDSVNGPCSR